MSGLAQGGTGHCLCGKVGYSFDGPPEWQAHCHCESCRRATSSPFTSFFGVLHANFRWTGTPPAARDSSPGVRRFFCAACGSPMAYQDRERTDEIDLYAATLSDPRLYAPERHVHWNERLPWVRLADGLPVRRTPRRLTPGDDFAPVLSLVRDAFAFMEGRIDPPSSVARLTTASLAASAAGGEIWVLDDPDAPEGPIACTVLTAHSDHLYLGKLAVAPAFRRQGLARQLVGHAADRTRTLGLAELRLETRVELTENHAAFRAMGFAEIGRTAHAGFDRPTSITFSLRP